MSRVTSRSARSLSSETASSAASRAFASLRLAVSAYTSVRIVTYEFIGINGKNAYEACSLSELRVLDAVVDLGLKIHSIRMVRTPGALASALTARLRNLDVSASASHRSAVRPQQVSAAEFAKRASRRAAVLVPLCAVYGHLCLLFTLRSRDVGSHKGHVSFPGGHVDGAESAREAAVRELVEEVGADLQLSAQDVAVLGTAPPVQRAGSLPALLQKKLPTFSSIFP